MDAIKDILSEFIDKKELVKGLFSKIQSAIFLDKLQESKTDFVSKRAYEPYIQFPSKNFEIKFYLPDYFDNYNSNKPARMYIRTINGVMPYLKLLVKIYTDTGIIPKVVELYQFGREVSIVSIPEIPYLHIYTLNNNIYMSVTKIDIYEIKESNEIVLLNTISPTYFNLLNHKYVFKFNHYWNMQYIENEKEDLFEKNKITWYIFNHYRWIVNFVYWTKLFAKKFPKQIKMTVSFILLFFVLLIYVF